MSNNRLSFANLTTRNKSTLHAHYSIVDFKQLITNLSKMFGIDKLARGREDQLENNNFDAGESRHCLCLGEVVIAC